MTNGVVFPLDKDAARHGYLVATAAQLSEIKDLWSSKTARGIQSTHYFTNYAGIGLDATAVRRRITYDLNTGQVIEDLRKMETIPLEDQSYEIENGPRDIITKIFYEDALTVAHNQKEQERYTKLAWL